MGGPDLLAWSSTTAYGDHDGNTIAGRRVALRGAQYPLRAAAGVLGRSSPVPSGSVAFAWAEFSTWAFSKLGGRQAWHSY